MDEAFVLVSKETHVTYYYCGYYVNGKPAITTDFKKAAMFTEEGITDVHDALKDGFKVEQHGW